MFIAPMLLDKVEQPFIDNAYLWEPKIDGHRLELVHMNGQTKLYTRHHTDCTSQYPELSSLTFDRDVILDGEVCCVNPASGKVDFELIMERFHTSPSKVLAAAKRNPIQFVVWDILYFGEDFRNVPLIERKKALDAAVSNGPHVVKIPYFEADGVSLFEAVKQQGLEGCVAKTKNSLYYSARRPEWKKLINYTEATCFIAGYKKDKFGWIVSMPNSFGGLRPVGVVELGVPSAHRKAFYSVAQGIRTDESKDTVYIDPQIRIKVRFRNWTSRGMLRTPSFVDFVWDDPTEQQKKSG
ncbi:ATP-dependent DNA ligase [Brevibacillus sp. 179-C9.3 HS]|uniref:ATP-dependent DNA ligase n=1 Tax=unclassified Brevibacillus TaxID=2684853 RepID=UPI0039A061E1